MNKNESKYFNTAVKMDEALIRLLEKKDFEYITVKEICQEAGVNRSTFYLHYETVGDLLEETTRYMVTGFMDCFSVDMPTFEQQCTSGNLQELIFITPEYLHPYLTFIRDNRRVFTTALQRMNTLDFNGVYRAMFARVFDPVLARFEYPAAEREYVMRFYLTGITAVVTEWLSRDCAEPVEDISCIIRDCVLGKDRPENQE